MDVSGNTLFFMRPDTVIFTLKIDKIEDQLKEIPMTFIKLDLERYLHNDRLAITCLE